jgi:hypothetical protein
MADKDDKKPDEKKAKAAPKLVPNAEGNVMVEAIMGPYRGQRLTMPAADGDAAISAHWARDPTEALYEHDALSEEERTAAFDAAHAWANAQWEAAQSQPEPAPVEPPPEARHHPAHTAPKR